MSDKRSIQDELYEALEEMTIQRRRADGLEHLLLDLTPGGSEFAGSPEACARWVRERLASTGRLAAERNRLRGQVEILTEALQPFARVWESPEPFYPLDLDHERASEVLAQIREAKEQ